MNNQRRPPTLNDGSTDVVLETQKLVGGGRALAHLDGETWLVAGALPGERVRVELEGRRAGIVTGKAVEVLDSPSPGRHSLPCPHASDCGGCDWPHVDPDQEAGFKVDSAAEAARNWPELAERLATAPIRPSPPAYRLRARLHWAPSTSTLGFYFPRSHRVAAIPDCRVVSARLGRTLERLTHLLRENCPEPVDVEWLEDLEGEHVVAALRPGRSGPVDIDPGWLPTEQSVGGAVDGFHLLDRRGHRVQGWGHESVTMNLPVVISVPIGSFFQGNRHLAGWLFDRVVDVIGSKAVATWDLHAGVGYLAAAAHHAAPRELHLVEPFRPAALAAQRNLSSATVAVGRTAEAYLGRAGDLPQQALALTDPPRTGMTPELRKRLADWHPERIVMLACDPATWSRDTRFLTERGYRLSHLELVDLFPSTHHVEILAVLENG